MARSRVLLSKGHNVCHVTPILGTPDQEIARLAYKLYEQRGRVDGRDLEDWLKAENIVRERRNG